MTDRLPQRPFTALPTPPDGLATALRNGRRMRLRRRLAGAGAAAAAVVVAAGAAFAVGGSTTGASDTLVPATRPSTSAAPVSPVEPGTPAVRSADRQALTVDPRVTGDGSAAHGTVRSGANRTAPEQSPRTTATGTTAQPPAAYRTPDLVRTYRAPRSGGVSPTQGPNPSVCPGGFSGGRSGVDATNDWCMTATVTRTARGHDLSLVVCRDSTGPGQLHYTRRREADLVVLSAGKPVWQWSTGHEDVADQHVLAVDAEGCWTWTAPWTDVDSRGRGLEPGDYTLAVSTPASELRGFDGREVVFSID